MIELALSGLEPGEYSSLPEGCTISEIDFTHYLLWNRSEKALVKRAINKKNHRPIWSANLLQFSHPRIDPSVGEERFNILLELADLTRAYALILRAPAQLSGLEIDQKSPFSQHRFPIFFDFPKSIPLPDSSLPKVVDPLWPTSWKPITNGELMMNKIHGWHPQRWIRRYSTEQIQEAVHHVEKARLRPETKICLIIGHSQRREQFSEFVGAIQNQVVL